MTNGQILEAYDALEQFEGVKKVINEEVITSPYDLDAQTRINGALNRNILRPFVDGLLQQRNAEVKKASGGKSSIVAIVKNDEGIEIRNPELDAFEEAWYKVLQQEQTVSCITMKWSELKVDKNKTMRLEGFIPLIET